MTPETLARRQRLTLLGVCVATFMLMLDINVVNVALPEIRTDIHAGLSGLQWIVDAYTATLAALLLTAGAVGDRVGRRLVFATGVVLFTLASAGCAAAQGTTSLDVARALQGVGGAGMFATSLALIAQEFPGPGRPGAITAWGATIGAGVAVGPMVGGGLTDAFGWRWIFIVNVPLGVLAVAIAWLEMGESRDERAAARIDVLGLLTFSAALFALLVALLRANAEDWSSPLIRGALVTALVLLGAFAIVERRVAHSMLDLALFGKPAFVGVSIATFALGCGMFAMLLFLSIYLQGVLGHSAAGAGLRMLPLTICVFVVPFLARRAAVPARIGLTLGLVLVSLGLLLMHGVTVGATWTALLPGFVLGGVGIGLSNPAIATTAIGVIEPARSGMASGISNVCRLGGLAVGIAALGALFEHRIGSELAARVAGPLPDGAAATVASGGVPSRVDPLASQAAFVAGMHEILLVATAASLAGALAAGALIRRRDFLAVGTAVPPGSRPAADSQL